MSKFKSNRFWIQIVLIGLLGCLEPTSDPKLGNKEILSDESVDHRSSKSGKTQAAEYYTDWSGQIEVIVLDATFGYNQHNYGAVALPSDYVLIGGGLYYKY